MPFALKNRSATHRAAKPQTEKQCPLRRTPSLTSARTIILHVHSTWFLFFGHSPCSLAERKCVFWLTCQPCIRYLLPVNGSLGSKTLNWSASLSIFNWFATYSCISFPFSLLYRRNPKFAVSVCKFHVSPFLKYYRCTFPFQILHAISYVINCLWY